MLVQPELPLLPKNHSCRELTPEQKEENKQISRRRIFIEHLIRRLKIFRIAADKFRLNPENYQTVILTICGLVRLRLGTFSLAP